MDDNGCQYGDGDVPNRIVVFTIEHQRKYSPVIQYLENTASDSSAVQYTHPLVTYCWTEAASEARPSPISRFSLSVLWRAASASLPILPDELKRQSEINTRVEQYAGCRVQLHPSEDCRREGVAIMSAGFLSMAADAILMLQI